MYSKIPKRKQITSKCQLNMNHVWPPKYNKPITKFSWDIYLAFRMLIFFEGRRGSHVLGYVAWFSSELSALTVISGFDGPGTPLCRARALTHNVNTDIKQRRKVFQPPLCLSLSRRDQVCSVAHAQCSQRVRALIEERSPCLRSTQTQARIPEGRQVQCGTESGVW